MLHHRPFRTPSSYIVLCTFLPLCPPFLSSSVRPSIRSSVRPSVRPSLPDLAGVGGVRGLLARWRSAAVYGQINSKQAGLSIRHYNPDCFLCFDHKQILDYEEEGINQAAAVYSIRGGRPGQSTESFRLTKQVLACLCCVSKSTQAHTHNADRAQPLQREGEVPKQWKVQTMDLCLE